MKFYIYNDVNMFYGFKEKMTSSDADDVIPGKIGYLTRNAKSGVNNIGFL